MSQDAHLHRPRYQVNVQRGAHSGEEPAGPCKRASKKKDRPTTNTNRQGYQKAEVAELGHDLRGTGYQEATY